MKRFVASLCLLLFLCGCSADPFAQKGGAYVSSLCDSVPQAVAFSGGGRTVTLTGPDETSDALGLLRQFSVRSASLDAFNEPGATHISAEFQYPNGSTRSITFPYFQTGGNAYVARYDGESVSYRQLASVVNWPE